MATIVQQLEESQKACAAAISSNVEQAAQIVAITGERDAAKTAHADAVKAHADELAKVKASATKASEDLAGEIAAHGSTKQQLEKAQHALAHPAFADAATRGEKKPTAEGGTGTEIPPATPEQVQAEYRKIEDPVARARFRNEHKKELGIA